MKTGERDDKGGGKKWNYKSKRQQRLGGKGGGLSLEAFSKAKSMPSGYNPSLIKKQKEFYKNAKLVKKYKSSVKPDNNQSYQLPTQVYEEGESSMPKQKKRRRKTLESLKEDSERKRQEKEREKLEREAMIKARKEAIEKTESKRKALKGNMFKRTRSGQPVMKYRIQHMLDGLLESDK